MFKEELSNGVVPYRPRNPNLPRAGISISSFEHVTTISGMDRVALALMSKFSDTNSNVIYGFDLEWNREDQIVRILILSFPGEQVKVCNLSMANVFSPSQFPKQL